MAITPEEVRHVALLSRIALPDEEVERFTGQLDRILDYVNQLGELDTSAVEPMSHPHEVTNVFRPDEVREGLTPAEAVSNAPEARANMFLVPRVIDEG